MSTVRIMFCSLFDIIIFHFSLTQEIASLISEVKINSCAVLNIENKFENVSLIYL